MKFKVSNAEMLCLIDMMEQLDYLDDTSINTKLVVATLQEFNLKLMQRALMKKDKYRIEMKPAQAIAFFLAFHIPVNPATQAGNMVLKMCNAIHQQLISK